MRRRLVAVALATTSLVAVAFAVPLALLARNVARDRALTAAERDLSALAPVLALTDDPELIGAAIARTSTGADGRLTVWTARGQVGDATPADPTEFELARQGRLAFSAREGGGRVLYQPVLTGTGTVAVVRARVSGAELTEGVRSAWAALAAVAIGLVGAAVLIADALGRSVTRPARHLAAVARRLGHGELDERAAGGGPPEIADAAQALNFLADRIEELLEAERERVADLSHRLRTPLTALRLDAEASGEAALLRGVDRLEEAVSELIVTARRPLYSRRAAEPPSCDVADVARERAEYWGALADEQARPWECQVHGAGPWLVALSPRDAAAAVDTLVGNVFSHTPEGTAYRVAVEADADGVIVAVDDAGPGVADPALVVERGHSGAGSTGLGLDIARRSAEEAGGHLTMARSTLGGTRVALHLPRFATGR